MTLKVLLFGFAGFLASFSPLSAQMRVYDKREFAPTAFHETIYRMMETCSGVSGEYENIRWHTAQIILVGDLEEGIQWIGAWFQRRELVEGEWIETEISEIILDREFVFDGNIVSHEALHDLYGGAAPMDTAAKCVLDWSRLTYMRRLGD